MFTKVIIAFALFSSSVLATYEDCGSEVGSVQSVSVSNCGQDDPRCILKRNTNATIEIRFTSKTKSDVLNAVVHGIVLGVPMPFALPQPDGCKDSGVTCPLVDGQSYNYTATLPVERLYPKVTVDVKWQLQDKDGKDVVCVTIPSRIR